MGEMCARSLPRLKSTGLSCWPCSVANANLSQATSAREDTQYRCIQLVLCGHVCSLPENSLHRSGDAEIKGRKHRILPTCLKKKWKKDLQEMRNWDVERKQSEEGTGRLALCLNNLILLSAGLFQQLVWDPSFTINTTQSRERAAALLQQFTSRQWPKAALRRH